VLPAEPARLSSARKSIHAFLSPHIERDDLDDVVLCLQEAMKNAVRFAVTGEHFHVIVQVSDHRIDVTVRDHGPGFSMLRGSIRPGARGHTDPYAESGRGLFLMGRLMDELELAGTDGATVRMVKRLS
jgi:anti-sigma regulatory factor (Ser/Thr protein kinase)